MSDDIEEQFKSLVDEIMSRPPGWRERFEYFWKSNIGPGWKNLLGVAAINAFLIEDDPTDYLRVIDLIKEILAQEGDHDEIRASFVGTLVRLLAIVNRTKEAQEWYGQLKTLTRSNNSRTKKDARKMRNILRQQHAWLR